MKTYFTSDHHFNHTNIIRYCNRPYTSVEEMNEDMVRRWNETVSNEDTVYYLGDFSLQPKEVEYWLSRLNFKVIHLYLGNHDAPFKKPSLDNRYKQWGFTSVRTTGIFEKDQYKFFLSHLPYKGLEGGDYEERYADLRPTDKGDWMLCGHVHEKWKIKNKMINVGVDVWNGRPVSLETLLSVRSNNDGDINRWVKESS